MIPFNALLGQRPNMLLTDVAAPAQPAQADPWDMTDRYNTPLTPAEEAGFQTWLGALSKKLKRDVGRDLYEYDMRGAYKAGAGQAENGHFPDDFKKPNHPTFSDQSQYHGVDGFAGGTWVKGADGKLTFTPSATNLQAMSPDELRAYFDRVEPDATLNLPAP